MNHSQETDTDKMSELVQQNEKPESKPSDGMEPMNTNIYLDNQMQMMRELKDTMSYLKCRFQSTDDAEDQQSEWKALAIIVDRTCFLLVIVLFLLCSSAIIWTS